MVTGWLRLEPVTVTVLAAEAAPTIREPKSGTGEGEKVSVGWGVVVVMVTGALVPTTSPQLLVARATR